MNIYIYMQNLKDFSSLLNKLLRLFNNYTNKEDIIIDDIFVVVIY